MDLFNNPMIDKALKSLTPQQVVEYKKIGEHLYGGNSNFIDNKALNVPSNEESIAYIEEGLKAGLLPYDLTEDEIETLVNTYGENWYERYGFNKEEVPEPGLSLKVKEDIEMAIKKKLEAYK